MPTLSQVRKKLHQLGPDQLEVFRRKLEHGQPDWTADDYECLYVDRPDLRVRFLAHLGMETGTPSRDWVPMLFNAAVSAIAAILSAVWSKN